MGAIVNVTKRTVRFSKDLDDLFKREIDDCCNRFFIDGYSGLNDSTRSHILRLNEEHKSRFMANFAGAFDIYNSDKDVNGYYSELLDETLKDFRDSLECYLINVI